MLSGCVPTPKNESAAASAATDIVTIKGQFSYRQRIAVPPDAVAEFTLRDISVQDIEAPLLAKQQYALNGRQVPLPYELKVAAAKISGPGRNYGIFARITSADGQLLWITDTNFNLPPVSGDIIDMGDLPLVQVP